MSFFPNFTKDRLAADLTVGLGTGMIYGKEMLAMPDLPQLSAASLRVALTIFLVVTINNVEQEIIEDDEKGWHWDRNERPWMKALNTAALIALPELLTWLVQTSFEGDIGPMHTAKMIALLTAIGFSMMDVVKDLFVLAIQKKEIRDEIESEMQRHDASEKADVASARRRAREENERRLAEAKDVEERKALQDAIQRELDERKRLDEAERERKATERRKRMKERYKGQITWQEAVYLGRQMGKKDREIYRNIVKRSHPDVRSDVDQDVIQAINAAYDKTTNTFQI